MRVYGCYNIDEQVREKSSSGGVFYSLAKRIIVQGGVVYAAVYGDSLLVRHERMESLDKLVQGCGSKYVESELGNTFLCIKNDLSVHRKVLFVGSPCQCQGLQCCVGDNEDLVCIDFVCHGVPSKKAWSSYLESLKKRGLDIVSVNMRDKSTGWSHYNYSWKLTERNGKVHYQSQWENPYMKGYARNFFLRPSCYECKFKGTERTTDITLGDYWGVWSIQEEMDDNRGTSLVMIHTDKGQVLFEDVKSSLRCSIASIDKAIEANTSIVHQSLLPPERNSFFEQIATGRDFEEIIEKLTKPGTMDKLKKKMRKVELYMKKIIFWGVLK